ncbi:MAG: hypothetical protein AVDCRST_MAG71-2490, partial [uncultured Lysobacter sp.]
WKPNGRRSSMRPRWRERVQTGTQPETRCARSQAHRTDRARQHHRRLQPASPQAAARPR